MNLHAYLKADPAVLKGVMDSFLGEQIGVGISRNVYACKLSKDYVIKTAPDSRLQAGITANVIEWDIWNTVSMMPDRVKAWFCPCVYLSDNGTSLIMRRADPVTEGDLPSRVPWFFTDLKAENWGLLDGKPVCVDYASTLVYNGFISNRTRKANWSTEE